jgi:hypothetical protein
VEWVVVKGVSDFADGTKKATESWQPFASAMAASVVYNMFQYPDVIQQWPHYTNTVQGATSTAGNNYSKKDSSRIQMISLTLIQRC